MNVDNNKLVGQLWRYRKPALAICIALVAILGWQVVKLRVDNSLEIWFPDDDPALVHYQQFQKQFGNDEVLVIALQDDAGMISRKGLQRLQAATKKISTIKGIASVTSLATLMPIERIASLPSDQLDATRARLLADPALTRQWISRDGTLAVLAARLAATSDIDNVRERILADVKHALDGTGPYHLAGIGVIYSALNAAATRDSALVTGAAYLLMVVLLWNFYRRWRPLLVTLAIVGGAMILLLGIYAANGKHINMVTMVLPTLVLIIGVSTSVHLLLNIVRLPANLSPRERVIRGIGQMFWPCLINTVTTAIGFVSLASSPMPVVRDLGVFAAVGVIIAFLLSIIISVAVAGNPAFAPLERGSAGIRRGVSRLTELAVHHPARIGVLTMAVAVLAVVGITRLEVDTYTIQFLFPDHPVRQDSQLIQDRIGPYTPLEFTVKSNSSGDSNTGGDAGVMRPQVFAAVVRWQQRVQQAGLAGWSDSLPLRQTLGRLKKSQNHSAGSVTTDLSALVHDNNTLRVTFGVPMQSAKGISNTINRMETLAALPPDVTLTATGYLPLYVRMIDLIVSTQLSSFAIAFLVIVVLLTALFRSLRFTGLILLSNIVPVLVLLGTMGWLGIRLDAATVTISAIVFGLVVDDTVQFLYRFRQESARHDTLTAIHETVATIGHSMALTTIVMVVGFLVLALAAIKSIVFFGLLIALAMATALLADVLILPATLSWMERYETREAEQY
jgi:predicted RND superfamily exporter protein